jgi:diphosphomevalonate decarboxylase
LARDFAALGAAAERDALSLHAVAMTSQTAALPAANGILYFTPETVRLLQAVPRWRGEGLPVAFTLDAGPAVHLLCEGAALDSVLDALAEVLPGGVTPIVSRPGRGVWIVQQNDGAEAPSDPSCIA